ncbi:MAG: CHASE3 domain-containing protein [Cyanobacteria bacterium SZAS TMP-1]|nr:CHASE3 domain-containing protein [Cyanobacteria bacterium SZAS TMP-1]
MPTNAHMPKSTNSAVSLRDFAGLFLALTAIATVAILLFSLLGSQEDADLGIGHSRALYRDSQALLISSAEANTNIRNYIMTRDPRYLDLYKRSRTDLQKETDTLLKSTRSAEIQGLLKERLAPALQSFLGSSDSLIGANAANLQEKLLKQEIAGTSFNKALESVQTGQAKILRHRNDLMLQIASNLATLRVIILLVAFLAILFSIFTLRSVMKKDREKIRSLEEAVTRMQAAERAAFEALETAQRSNELKAQFMSNISHEIRTPMTGILGVADLLCHSKVDGTTRTYSELLMQSSQQLLNVLNDLLNFSLLQKGNLALHIEPFAIRKTIAELVENARPDAQAKNLTISATVDPAVPDMIAADEERVRQVIAAMLSNSIKFTSEGGVQIAIAMDQQEGAKSTDTKIRIDVKDTGIGIADQDLNKIFTPFVQVDGGIRRSQGGSGLSLCIAKHLVELMAGRIGVTSKPGQGSVFWFTFAGVRP